MIELSASQAALFEKSNTTNNSAYSMLRDSKLAAFFLQAGLIVWFVVRDCFQAVFRPSRSTSKDVGGGNDSSLAATHSNGSGPGIIRKLFGWPPPRLEPARETAWLDGLRGVAAALVMTYHYHLSWHGPLVEAPWGAWPDMKWHFWRLPIFRVFYCSGHAQVCVFFVLSGFVLSWGTLGSLRAARYDKVATTLGSATFRRWWRLYLPCFIVGLFGMVLFRWKLIGLVVTQQDTFGAQLVDWFNECLRWANPFRLERSGAQTLYSYNWTMWTIPDEFAGSMLVFALCLAIARINHWPKRALVVFTIALWACVQALWTYWLFATGVLLADYVRNAGGFKKLSERTSWLGSVFWSMVFIAGLLLAGVPENNPTFPRPGYMWLYGSEPFNWSFIEGGVRFWWSWGGIFILAGACHLGPVRQFFELSFIRYLGRISFMLYVTHRTVEEVLTYPIRMKILHAVGHTEYNETWKTDLFVVDAPWGFVLWVLGWAFTGPLALFTAHWFEVFVDAPSTRFAKWLDDRFSNGFFPDEASDINRERTSQRDHSARGVEEEIGLLPIRRE